MADDGRQSSTAGHSPSSRRRLTPAQRAAARARSTENEVVNGVPITLEGRGSPTGAPLATMDVLQEFGETISRARDPKTEGREHRKLERHKAEIQRQRLTLLRLIKWADADIQTTGDWITYALKIFQRPPLPRDQELIALARQFYPPRMELKVHVCDFGDNRFERFETTVGEIEGCWQEKPAWAIVRWIHVPLGLGLTHSSVEEIFLHGGDRGRPFLHAANSPSWPYIKTEVLNFRSRQNFQDMRDVFIILSELEELKPRLNQISLNGDKNENLLDDIRWRSNHQGTSMGYWDLVESDMPWQLSEGISQGQSGARDKLALIRRDIEKQQLATHPFFRNSQLVRSIFRCFHRADGFLLTLSPPTGVNYLDKNFSKYLEEPVEYIHDNDDASALGHMLQVFAKSGTSTWHRKTVEWFLVYLITEVGATPHTVRQGHNAVSMIAAYRTVVQDLKRRRYDQWKRNESVKLVREYLICIDELTAISLILERKLQMFEGLLQDCKAFEAEDNARTNPDNPSGKSAVDRVVWATKLVKIQHDSCKGLAVELELAMNAVSKPVCLTAYLLLTDTSNLAQLFQLRSIEQNELAIVADSQNKAILVFTGVTIIFLPLSFFTSYFGMNLKGISNTDKDESFFWKVCGTVAFLIILFVILYAFRNRFRTRFMNPMVHSPIV